MSRNEYLLGGQQFSCLAKRFWPALAIAAADNVTPMSGSGYFEIISVEPTSTVRA
jgi:hypothetical protein